MQYVEMTYGNPYWNKTIDLAQNCSWQKSGHFLAEVMQENDFDENDRVFCAIDGDTVVGFLTFIMDEFLNNKKYHVQKCNMKKLKM